jgi:hypothetical protein
VLTSLVGCLEGLNLETASISVIRDVLDLRQRGTIAFGNLLADAPEAVMKGACLPAVLRQGGPRG